MIQVAFEVDGVPKGQPRPRAFAKQIAPGRFSARVHDSSTAEGWKSCIAVAAHPHMPPEPWEGPVHLVIGFYVERPKNHWRRGRRGEVLKESAPALHCGKPDLDNAVKAVMDCMTVLRLWHDDTQVVSMDVRREYRDKPGMTFRAVALARGRGEEGK